MQLWKNDWERNSFCGGQSREEKIFFERIVKSKPSFFYGGFWCLGKNKGI